ncbi:CU044_2847 family protein [Amycolatopsis sp. NPDC004772]
MADDTEEVKVVLTRDAEGMLLPEPVELWVEARAEASRQQVAGFEFGNLDRVLAAVKTVAGSVAHAVRAVRPEKFSVEMAFTVKAEAGGLVALLVRSGGEATLTVTLEWEANSAGDSAAGAAPAVN